MRLLLLPIALTLLATPVLAQQVSPMTGTTTTTPKLRAPAPAAASPAPAAAPAPAKAEHAERRQHRTMLQHFEAANTSHDGKLTLAQAKADKWTRVAKHFDAIDTAHHGYVTIDDIHAFNRAQYAARRAAKKAGGKPASAAASAPMAPKE